MQFQMNMQSFYSLLFVIDGQAMRMREKQCETTGELFPHCGTARGAAHSVPTGRGSTTALNLLLVLPLCCG